MKNKKLLFLISNLLLVNVLLAQTVYPVKQNGKWGLINKQGTLVHPATFDAISPYNKYGVAVTLKNNLVGLLDENGAVLLPNEYTKIEVIDTAVFLVKKFDQKEIIYKNKVLYKGSFDSVRLIKNVVKSYFKINDKNKLSVVFSDGKILLENIDAQHITILIDDYSIVQNKNKKGLYHKNKAVIRSIYDEIIPLGNKHFKVINGEFAGVLDEQAKIVIPIEYKIFEPLKSNSTIKHLYKAGDYRGFFAYDNKNETLSTERYENIAASGFSYILTYKNGQTGLLDTTLNVIFEPKHDEIKVYSAQNAIVANDQKWVLHNLNTKEQSKLAYQEIAWPVASFFACSLNNKWGLLNTSGRQVLPCSYTKIDIEEEESQIKAWKGEKLSIIDYDENGVLNLEEQANFAGFSTLNVGKTLQISTRINGLPSTTNDGMENYVWFENNKGKWGLRGKKDKKIRIKPQYDGVSVLAYLGVTVVHIETEIDLEIDHTHFKFKNVYGIVNNKVGLPVTSVNMLNIRFSDFDKRYPTARVVFSDGKHGLMKRNGKIIKKDCAYIGEFIDGLARISLKGTLAAQYKDEGKSLQSVNDYITNFLNPFVVSSYSYYDNKLFREGQLYCKDASFGVIDTLGNLQIPTNYTHIQNIHNEVFVATKNEKYGILSKDGTVITPFHFDMIKPLSSGTKLFETAIFAKKYGIMNLEGHLIFDTVYDNVEDYRANVLPFSRGNKWGLLDEKANEILTPTYQKIEPFSENMAACKTTKGWGFLNKEGVLQIPCTYQRVSFFSEGVAMAATSKGTGFVDTNNQFVIKPTFATACAFSAGHAKVTYDGQSYSINHEGKKVENIHDLLEKQEKIEQKVQKKNDIAQNLTQTQTYAHKNGTIGLAHHTGIPLTTSKYNRIETLPSGNLKVRLAMKVGIVSSDGTVIQAPIFDYILAAGNNIYRTESGNKIGYLNEIGQWIWDLKE